MDVTGGAGDSQLTGASGQLVSRAPEKDKAEKGNGGVRGWHFRLWVVNRSFPLRRGIQAKAWKRRGGKELKAYLGEDVLGRANSQCKGPEVGLCLVCLRSSEEACVP